MEYMKISAGLAQQRKALTQANRRVHKLSRNPTSDLARQQYERGTPIRFGTDPIPTLNVTAPKPLNILTPPMADNLIKQKAAQLIEFQQKIDEDRRVMAEQAQRNLAIETQRAGVEAARRQAEADAEEAERLRLQAEADAERDRLQAEADAERDRLQAEELLLAQERGMRLERRVDEVMDEEMGLLRNLIKQKAPLASTGNRVYRARGKIMTDLRTFSADKIEDGLDSGQLRAYVKDRVQKAMGKFKFTNEELGKVGPRVPPSFPQTIWDGAKRLPGMLTPQRPPRRPSVKPLHT